MFIKITEAAEALSVSERFLRRLVAEQRIPYYRLSERTLRIDLNELREHMRSVAQGTLQTEPETRSDG
jgi:excisionase family DNA binding protein